MSKLPNWYFEARWSVLDFKIAWFCVQVSLLFSKAESQLLGYSTGVPGDPTSRGHDSLCRSISARQGSFSIELRRGVHVLKQIPNSLSEKVYWTFDRLQRWKLLKEFVDSERGNLFFSPGGDHPASGKSNSLPSVTGQADLEASHDAKPKIESSSFAAKEAIPMRQETKKALLAGEVCFHSKMSCRSWE